MNLKFLRHEYPCVSFLKKLAVLNLKVYRASYVQHNPYWSKQGKEFKGLFQKNLSPSFQVQWAYNLYG